VAGGGACYEGRVAEHDTVLVVMLVVMLVLLVVMHGGALAHSQ
jgi:hypothetical protein